MSKRRDSPRKIEVVPNDDVNVTMSHIRSKVICNICQKCGKVSLEDMEKIDGKRTCKECLK